MDSQSPVLSSFAIWLTDFIYKEFAGFPKNTSVKEVVYTQKRVCALDFKRSRKLVEKLNSNPRMFNFMAYANDDHLIERERFVEMSGILKNEGGDQRLVFERGGHNVQKSRAQEIARNVVEWVGRISQFDREERSDDT